MNGLTKQIVELLPYKVKDIGLAEDGRKALKLRKRDARVNGY